MLLGSSPGVSVAAISARWRRRQASTPHKEATTSSCPTVGNQITVECPLNSGLTCDRQPQTKDLSKCGVSKFPVVAQWGCVGLGQTPQPLLFPRQQMTPGRRGKELNLLPLPCAGSALPMSYAP